MRLCSILNFCKFLFLARRDLFDSNLLTYDKCMWGFWRHDVPVPVAGGRKLQTWVEAPPEDSIAVSPLSCAHFWNRQLNHTLLHVFFGIISPEHWLLWLNPVCKHERNKSSEKCRSGGPQPARPTGLISRHSGNLKSRHSSFMINILSVQSLKLVEREPCLTFLHS